VTSLLTAPPGLPEQIARLSPAQQTAWAAMHPVRFSQFLLGHNPWDIQRDILESVYVNKRTAVKACHASGKTFIAADAVLWWPLRYPDGIVITTAPTWTQVRRLLWGEVRKTAQLGRVAFPHIFQTELQLGPDNFALGLSTNEGVRFQGWHAPHILIVLDEAPGVMTEIFEAIEGVEAGGNVHLLMLGNPLSLGGPFYDAFHKNARFWTRFTIDAFHTPNLIGLSLDDLLLMEQQDPDALHDNVRPYLTRREYVVEKWHAWTEASPLWEGKILAQFPRQGDDYVFPLPWVEAAAEPMRETPAPVRATFLPHSVSVGIDVAGPGEAETVTAVVDDWTGDVLEMRAWAQPDPRGPVTNYVRGLSRPVSRVNGDADGIGFYFCQDLADAGLPVNFIHIGVPANDQERFADLKAEGYWGLRERLTPSARQIGRLKWARLIGQMTTQKYGHDKRGRVQIESKEKARERGVESPDWLEALVLATMPDPPRAPERAPALSTHQVTL
jgi:phage terminase large subunit